MADEPKRKFREKNIGDGGGDEKINDSVKTNETERINLENIIEEAGKNGAGERGGEERGETGRKRGKARKSKSEGDLSLSEAIFEIHGFFAFLTQMPELSITKEQSDRLESAINKVDINIKNKISPKTFAYLNLATILLGIYAPKVISVVQKVKNRKGRPKLELAKQ